MTMMMMKSESEIDYPNITPCPDFGIKNPSLRSWPSSTQDTWTDTRMGDPEMTDEDSASRTVKKGTKCEKVCRSVLCVFLVLSVLAAAFAGIGLAILLTQPEFGLSSSSHDHPVTHVDVGLDESQHTALTDIFCSMVKRILEDVDFPTEKGLESCEVVLRLMRGSDGLHIEVHVNPSDGYTLKEKFLRALAEHVLQRSENNRTKTNDVSPNRDNSTSKVRTGLIFPKNGDFINFTSEVTTTNLGNNSVMLDNVINSESTQTSPTAVDVTEVTKRDQRNTSDIIDKVTQIVSIQTNSTPGDNKPDITTVPTTLDVSSKQGKAQKDSTTAINKKKSKVKTDRRPLQNGDKEIIIKERNRLENGSETNDKPEGPRGGQISPKMNSTHNIQKLNEDQTTIDVTGTSTTKIESGAPNPIDQLSAKPELLTSVTTGFAKNTEPQRMTKTTPETYLTTSSSTKVKLSFPVDSTLNLSVLHENVIEKSTSMKAREEADSTTQIPMENSSQRYTKLFSNTTNIMISTDATILPELTTTQNNDSAENKNEINKAAIIKRIKLFEIDSMENTTEGIALNSKGYNSSAAKSEKDFVAESLMSGGVFRLPMRTTSNFKFLFASGSSKNTISTTGNDKRKRMPVLVVRQNKQSENGRSKPSQVPELNKK